MEDAIEMEMYVHSFTHEETIDLVTEALEGKAKQWESEAFTESFKGAANTSMIETLRWGAGQLRAIAQLIESVPPTELRAREKLPSFSDFTERVVDDAIPRVLSFQPLLIGGDHSFPYSNVTPTTTSIPVTKEEIDEKLPTITPFKDEPRRLTN